MTTLTTEVLESLPDGEYKTNDIYPLYFKKKNGFIELDDGKLRTYEEFAAVYGSVTVELIEI